MPKSTFLNLPRDKRERITRLALDEFSAQPYRQASMTQIAVRAGIAKGSIYQYFHNKLDLYTWLVTQEVEARRIQWLACWAASPTRHEPKQSAGTFEAFEELMLTRVGFMLEHPQLARLAAAARKPSTDPDLHQLHAKLRDAEMEALELLLAQGASAGELRPGLDLRTLAHLMESLVEGTTRAVLSAREASKASPWRESVRQTVDLLRIGASSQDPVRMQAANTRPISSIEWQSIDESVTVELPS